MSATSATAQASNSTASVESYQTIVPAPTPVLTRTGTSLDRDDFFGYSMAFRTHDSRHDDPRQSLAVSDVLPSYAEEAAIPLPEYTLHAPEPVTLAMYLFKFGFLFPPFWFFGAFILLSPLREPPSNSDSEIPAWMPEKTEEERQQIIANIRQVELKWARRCLCAFLALVVLATAAGIAAWLVLHH